MHKILYLTYHPQIGGGETILLALLSSLDRKLFEPLVVIPQKDQLYNQLQYLKIKTFILPLNGYLIRTLFIPGMSPVSTYQFFKLVQKIKPALIHLNHLNLAVYAGISAKLLKVPAVATAHGSWDSIYLYQDFINNIFIDKILANTSELKTHLIKRKIIKPKKIDVICFGVDTSKFLPASTETKRQAKRKFGFTASDFVITIVGRLDPAKDHLTFLKAAKIINRELPSFSFFIVGSKLGDFSGWPHEADQSNSYYKQINRFLSANLTLAKKVVFGGFIEDMPKAYWASDVVVSTSPTESFGLALAEAASCGIPIVSTKTASPSLIVKNNQTGFLVSPKDPRAVAQKILTLALNPQLSKKLGNNGRNLILKKFTLQNYASKIQEVYLSLLTNQLKSKKS